MVDKKSVDICREQKFIILFILQCKKKISKFFFCASALKLDRKTVAVLGQSDV